MKKAVTIIFALAAIVWSTSLHAQEGPYCIITPGKLTLGTVTRTSIALSWTAATFDENSSCSWDKAYWVQWKKKGDAIHSYQKLPLTTLSYTITGLEPHTEYEILLEVTDGGVINAVSYNDIGIVTTADYYGIRVAGVELSSDNKDAIDKANFPRLSISRGSITFDHATKTFTLRDLKAEVNEATFLDFISLEGGYKIHLVGSNEIQVSGNRYSGIELYNNLTITGSSESSLKIESQIPVFVDIQSTLTIKNATVELTSYGDYGITGRYGDDGEKLIIDNSTVKAFGAKGSIANLEDITLKSCHIAYPAGAAIATNGSKGKAVMKNGQVVKEQVVIQPDGTGIDNPLAAALTLYPNPVESILHIEAEGEVRSIRIYNTYGTEVATATATKQIDLSHLPAGVYALRVETERGVATQRVVKR